MPERGQGRSAMTMIATRDLQCVAAKDGASRMTQVPTGEEVRMRPTPALLDASYWYRVSTS
jgi:hypothetical protein